MHKDQYSIARRFGAAAVNALMNTPSPMLPLTDTTSAWRPTGKLGAPIRTGNDAALRKHVALSRLASDRQQMERLKARFPGADRLTKT